MSILEQLQADVTARLNLLADFVYVPVILARPRSEGEATLLQAQIDNTLAGLQSKNGKSGATVIVQMPTLDVPEPDVPGPQMMITLSIRVIENPLVNMGAAGSGLSAESIGLNVLNGLHHWDPGLASSPLYADQRAMEPNEQFPGKVAYDVFMRTRLGLAPQLRGPSVRAERYGNTVALVCPEPVRYTLDGSLPLPTSALYAAPIVLTSGQVLRAASFPTGTPPGDVVMVEG